PRMADEIRRSPIVALQHRNFRLLWSSQLVSMAGSMMQSAAILWHISLLVPPGRRGLALGMVGLVRILPIIGFSAISGVVADALDRRKLMLLTQRGMAVAGGELGVGWAYALNALSFGFVIAALLMMRDVPRRAQGGKGEISLRAAAEGLRFVFENPLIRSTMLLDFFATFFASATALLPIFAQ